MKLNPAKTQYERDEQEYYANRSKYRHIKPYANSRIVSPRATWLPPRHWIENRVFM